MAEHYFQKKVLWSRKVCVRDNGVSWLSERVLSAVCGYPAFPAWHGQSEQSCGLGAPLCGAEMCGCRAEAEVGLPGISRGGGAAAPWDKPWETAPGLSRCRAPIGGGVGAATGGPRRVPRSRRAARGFPAAPRAR